MATDWDDFRKVYRAASARFAIGDGHGVAELFGDGEDVSICGAFGGYEIGGDAVRTRVAWAGSQHAEGTFEEQILTEWVGGDSAYTLSIETIVARVGGATEPATQVLRVTQVYRRGTDGWRIVHRHADHLRPTSPTVPPA
jgi:SnoaL-like domain